MEAKVTKTTRMTKMMMMKTTAKKTKEMKLAENNI